LKRLRVMGAEEPGERERAGLGGWRAAGISAEGVKHKARWRDEERRATHRGRMVGRCKLNR